MIETVFGHNTSKETGVDVNFAPPFAYAAKVMLKIPSSEVSRAIFRHASDASGGDGHPG